MKRPEMPSLFQRNDTRKWCLSYTDPVSEKRIRETVSTRKKDAEKRAAQVYQQQMAIYLGEPDADIQDITLPDLINRFFESRKHHIATITETSYKAKCKFLRDFMTDNFPAVRSIRQIKKVYLEEFLKSRLDSGKSYRTVEADLQVVKMIFSYAVEEGFASLNPAQKIKRYKNPNPRASIEVQYWTKDEVSSILSEIKPGWRDAHEFLYNTGLRKAELINLTWNDVSLDTNPKTITIQAKNNWTPKNKESRIIPLNNRASDIISRQPNGEKDEYVFKGPGGAPQIHRDKIYRELKRSLNVLGLEGNVHQWRHTFASHLVMSDVSIQTVSKLLGHSDIQMTMIYAHLSPNHLYSAVICLDR